MRKVYLDLDGVFVNIVKKYIELFGEDYLTMSPKNMWNKISEMDHFFLHLEPYQSYDNLFNLLTMHPNVEYEILTALPIPNNKLITAKSDKERWVKKYLSKTIKVNTIIGGKNKGKFVKSPTDILIDDMKRNIDAWESAGGIGILHDPNDPLNTIVNLTEILNNEEK